MAGSRRPGADRGHSPVISTRFIERRLPVPVAPDQALPLALDDHRIDTPAILVDLDVAEQNITRMAGYARRVGLTLRPHFKTHKSAEMGGRQLAAGATGLCVATASEAEAVLAASIYNLTVAYPLIGDAKLARLSDGVADQRVTLTSDSDAVTESYAAFARRIGTTVPVLIEVDTGMHRAGAPPQQVLDRARRVAAQTGLEFAGILTHAGHAHDVPGPRGIAGVAREEAAVMGDLRAVLEGAGLPPRVVSAGSTLTAPFLTADDGITEIRPGTYIYNDLRTLACWSCTPDALAVTALSTVVSTDGIRATINAGSKTLTTSKDPAYGHGYPQHAPDVSFQRLSEEHGVLNVPNADAPYQVGDRVQILPIHVCVWMDLQPEIYGTRAGRIVERIRIDALRHSL